MDGDYEVSEEGGAVSHTALRFVTVRIHVISNTGPTKDLNTWITHLKDRTNSDSEAVNWKVCAK
jgi:hypothetical protein